MIGDMHQVVEGLVYRSDFDLSYGGTTKACCYFVRLKRGNVVIGSCGSVLNHIDFMRRFGGVSHILLTHNHEAGRELSELRAEFSASVICHQQEVAFVRRYCPVDIAFAGEIVASENIFSLETPGHSQGSVCYVLDRDQQRVLFPGDTIYLSNGNWVVAYEGETGPVLASSLKKIARLNVGWVLPGIVVGETMPDGRIGPSWPSVVADVIQRVEAGLRH